MGIEYSSAFKPKKQSGESRGLPAEAVRESPLQDVEKDKASTAIFNKIISFLSRRDFTSTAQLDAFINPRFAGGYLLNSSGGYQRTADNEVIRENEVPAGLSNEQAEIFKRMLSEKLQAEEEDGRTEAEIITLRKTFELIRKGDLNSPEALTSLLNPRFSSDYLLNSSGGYQRGADNRVIRSEEVGGPLGGESAGVLQELLEGKLLVQNEAQEAKDEQKSFSLTLTVLVANTSLAESVVQSLLNPRFAGGYLLNSSGSYQRTADNRVIRSEEIGTGLSAEQADLIKEIAEIYADKSIPEEVKQNLKLALTEDSDVLRTRMSSVMEMSADLSNRNRIVALLEKFSRNKQTTALRAQIYGGIVGGKPPEELSQQLGEYDEADLADRTLVATLQASIDGRRRFNAFETAVASLGTKDRNVDAVLATANKLLGSKSELDQRAGLLLATEACRAEIATFRKQSKELLAKNDVTPEEFRLLIEGLPVRPTIGDIDYVEAIAQTRDEGFKTIADIEKNRRLEETVRIRASFAKAPIPKVLEDIRAFPSETAEDGAIKEQLLTLYRSYVATNRPKEFDETFSREIQAQQEAALKARFVSPELGRNKEAFNYIRSNFVEVIYPLIESLRADATTAETVEEFLGPGDENAPRPRRRFQQRLADLEKQRPLTDIERNYLQSVQLLSLFNPYLVAAVYADQGVTSEFLRHHFDTLSQRTLGTLKNGDYVPLIQIGTGPNGTTAMGELVRNNPELARQSLVIDGGKQPGGPFAIPGGPAWELNSANRRGATSVNLPDSPNGKELTTVRAYGSPVRWYPGERANKRSVRQGSINVTVDYLPTPDDLSTARYPTNEELQTILSLQWALLAENLALKTRFVDQVENPDKEAKGTKLVTLEVTEADGSRRMLTLATDAIWGATGLGESGYGFQLPGSRAEKVMQKSEEAGGFPKLSRTLDAFEALAGRRGERFSPGETLVIYGKGNSADTLVEYIGSIFQGDNPRVRDVTKVYVIADGDLSARPRYSLINDLKPRNGRGNLIEQVKARVVDVDFAGRGESAQDKKLVFYGPNGAVLKDAEGKPIVADSAIAATGFRPDLDSRLETNGSQKKKRGERPLRSPLVLPTNPSVPVAETLTDDPTVLILGTASKAEFEKLDKLAQLPVEAREALLRNGAENAVAIGFRAPDTQAAVNIWLNSQDITLEPKAEATRTSIEVSQGERMKKGTTTWLTTTVNPENLFIPNNVESEVRFLSPLFAYNIGNKIELKDSQRQSGNFTGELTFELTSNPDQKLGLTFTGGAIDEVSQDIIEVVKSACTDPDFEKYALVALQKKRRNQKLDLILAFRDGKVDPRNTFVQG